MAYKSTPSAAAGGGSSSHRRGGSGVRESSSRGRQSVHLRTANSPAQRTPRSQPPRAPSPSFGPRRPPLHPGTPKLATDSPRRTASPRKAPSPVAPSPPSPPPQEQFDVIQEDGSISPPPEPPQEIEIGESRPTRVRRSSPKFRRRADSFGSDAGGVSPSAEIASDRDILLDTDVLMVSAATTSARTPRTGMSPMEEMMTYERKYFRSTLPKRLVNPCGYCCRILFTIIWIVISIIISATVFTQSTEWFSELTCIRAAHTYGEVPGYSKVFAAWDVTGTHDTIEGSRCRLWFQFDPTQAVSHTEMKEITDYSLDTGAVCGFFTTDEFSGDCAGAHCWACISALPCSHVVDPSVTIADGSRVSWSDMRFPPYFSNSSPLRLTMDEKHRVTVNNAVIGLEPVCSADGN
ncbi:hypothetical protein FOZ62_030028, partial [Perkinsus olseni]